MVRSINLVGLSCRPFTLDNPVTQNTSDLGTSREASLLAHVKAALRFGHAGMNRGQEIFSSEGLDMSSIEVYDG
jgi:hypothetical protein